MKKNCSPYLMMRTEVFSANLRRLLKRHRTNQRTLAKILHTSPQNVCRWVSGQVLPRVEMLEKLALHFNTDVKKLLEKSASASESIPVFKNDFSSDPVLCISDPGPSSRKKQDHVFGFLLSDNSYSHLGLFSGDILLCDPVKTPARGDIVLFCSESGSPVISKATQQTNDHDTRETAVCFRLIRNLSESWKHLLTRYCLFFTILSRMLLEGCPNG